MKYITGIIFLLMVSCAKEEPITPDAGDYTPTTSKGYIINHTYYTLSYSNSDRQSEFAYYYLSPQSINGGQSRTDDFRIDPLVTSNPVKSTDYEGSGYDRGHLCPAGDMKLNKISMSETFYMSNMIPIEPTFNREVWSKFEDWVRATALSNNGIYVVSGPILSPINNVRFSNIFVPNNYYKIVFKDGANPKIMGFIIRKIGTNYSFRTYCAPIDEIESLTGLDFFPQLEDKIENQIEKDVNISGWNL
jgi:endonuclease G